MTELELAPPIGVLPADAVDAFARSLRYEIAVLETELIRVTHEVDAVDATIHESDTFDLRERAEVEGRLRRFLDDWLRSEESEFRAAVDTAKTEAALRVRVAEVEADAIIAEAQTEYDSARSAPIALPAPVVVSSSPALAVLPSLEDTPTLEPSTAPPAADAQRIGSTWIDDALAALDLDDPSEALVAAAAVAADVADSGRAANAADATDDTTEPPPLGEISDADFQRVVGHDADGTGVIDAAPEEVYARFWKGERDAVATRSHARNWAALQVLLPMVAILMVLVLAGLLIG